MDFRKRFFAGILVAVPLGATLQVILMLFRFVDGLTAPYFARVLHLKFPGLGILLTLLVIYGLGLFARNVLGKRLVVWFEESVLGKVPWVRNIYSTLKKILETVSQPATKSFRRVVFVEFPRPGVQSVGFVTGETLDPGSRRRFLNVFIPTVPNPTSGLLQLIPEEKVTPSEMSVEEGIQLVVSGGFLSPKSLGPA